ncbi:putative multi-domain containing protein [Aduncisulcus paluster]|uniref:Multi-domain containing protein n=1 Tax=Aduncisulcus paluster TaxID=2918883 RepID=A0ABQ5KPB3_9EUKA|nr:putative multi-domain containing protein [Aduncisulcus paluster]
MFAVYDDSSISEAQKLLRSGVKKENLEGLRMLVSHISRGNDISAAFHDVVKLVVAESLEMKRLVYMIIAHYSESNPDAAIMSYNVFHKSLSDRNQLVRGLALRTLSSIRVKTISALVATEIDNSSRDSSPFVRKTACHAAIKVAKYDADTKDDIIKVIGNLLGDSVPAVLGSAVVAWLAICPDRYDLIHKHFHSICVNIADTDEWCQVSILKMLLHYARKHLIGPPNAAPKPKKEAKPESKAKKQPVALDLEDLGADFCFGPTDENEKKPEEKDEESESYSYSGEAAAVDPTELKARIERDTTFMLKSIIHLLKSRNPGVCLQACLLIYYCAKRPDTSSKTDDEEDLGISSATDALFSANTLGAALARCVELCAPEEAAVALAACVSIASEHKKLLMPYYKVFYIHRVDSLFVKEKKLNIIASLVSEENAVEIVRELKSCIDHRVHIPLSEKFSSSLIECVTRCAYAVSTIRGKCLDLLLSLIEGGYDDSIVGAAVIGMKNLLSSNSSETGQIEYTLFSDSLGHICDPSDVARFRGQEAPAASFGADFALDFDTQTQPAESVDSDEPYVPKIPEDERAEDARVVRRLVQLIPDLKSNPPALCAALWVAGEHCNLVPHLVPDIMRVQAKDLLSLDTEVKEELCVMSVKVALRRKEIAKLIARRASCFSYSKLADKNGNRKKGRGIPESTNLPSLPHLEALALSVCDRVHHLCDYILRACAVDADYDLRDRARLLQYACNGGVSCFNVVSENIIKPRPTTDLSVSDVREFVLGTITFILNKPVPGYMNLSSECDQSVGYAEREAGHAEVAERIKQKKSGRKPISISSVGSERMKGINLTNMKEPESPSLSKPVVKKAIVPIGEKKKDNFWGDEEEQGDDEYSYSGYSYSDDQKAEPKKTTAKADGGFDDIFGAFGAPSKSTQPAKKTVSSVPAPTKKTSLGDDLDILLGMGPSSSSQTAKKYPPAPRTQPKPQPVTQPKPTGIDAGLVALMGAPTQSQQGDVTREKMTLTLSNTDGRGVEVTSAFARGFFAPPAGHIGLRVCVTNRSPSPLAVNISGTCMSTPVSFGRMNVGQAITKLLFVKLVPGKPSIQLTVSHGAVRVNFSVKPRMGDLVRPDKMSQAQALSMRKNLMSNMCEIVLPTADISTVDKSVITATNLNKIAVGLYVGREFVGNKVVIVWCERAAGSLKLRVVAEKAKFGQLLMKFISKQTSL